MKIGDKVVFLSESGGGVVAGFQGRDVVLVEDEDGFQIPTAITDVVVVDNDQDYSTSNVVKSRQADAPKMVAPKKIEQPKEQIEERDGGDKLSAYMAFVPINIADLSNTSFESYLVNDSNYFISYLYMIAEGTRWTLRSSGEIPPNTKYFLEEFSHSQINDIAHYAVQFVAYKKDKHFMIKPPVFYQSRLDGVKFFKLHAFRENMFFEQATLLYPLVENGLTVQPDELLIPLSELQQKYSSMLISQSSPNPSTKKETLTNGKFEGKKKTKDNIVVIDLHASEILETTAGMTSGDILQYQLSQFNKVMSQYKNQRGQRIVFIHGKGEGVLRQAIISELRYKYKSCIYQDASFREYGYGATQVTIK